jgi:capsid protein
MIDYLNNGETVEFANPPSNSDYDSYSTRILQGIASAYGITYEMLTMDYSRVNFTSGRMAKIDVTANFKSWQYNMIVPQLCAPAWQWFMDACLIAGKIMEPIKADWTAPRVQQLDPVKETNAQIMKMKAGLATWSETIREIGREPEEFFEELQQDIARFKKAGLNYGEMIVSVNKNTENE